MYKKTIEGRTYFYTTYRDKNNKLRNEYLGTSESEAIEKEKQLQKKTKFPKTAIIFIFLGLLFITFLFQWNTFTGLFFLEESPIVTFDIDESWNLSNAFIRISQNETTHDISNLNDFISNNQISIDLRDYDLLEGYVYVDLIVDFNVVASKYIFFSLSYEEPEEIIEETSSEESIFETIIETFEEEQTVEVSEEPTTSIQETYDEWFDANSTSQFEVDYLLIEPQNAYANNTLTCRNGSVSSDVSKVYYHWYVNNNLVIPNEINAGNFTGGNYSVGDYVDCATLTQDTDNNLIAYYSFDKGTGNTVYDLVNMTNNGTILDSDSWSRGKYYNSILFSNTNYMNISNPPNLNASSAFTYEFWVNLTNIITHQNLFGHGNFTIKAKSGYPRIQFQNSSNEKSVDRIIGTELVLPYIWTHLAFTFNGSELRVYINGQLDNSTVYTGDIVNMAGNASIGKKIGGAASEAYIDEFAIFNTSLSATEILDHYENGIMTYSKNSTLIVDTTENHFGNGTLDYVNITYESSNMTLANFSDLYFIRGNFTSKIFELKEWNDEAFLKWNNVTPAGTNLTFQLRSGHRLYNQSIIWSEFSGSDPTRAKDDRIVLALDFNEEEINLTRELRTAQNVMMRPNDFVYDGYHSQGALFFGRSAIAIANAFTDIRLSTVQNYSFELWVKPRYTVGNIGLFTKDKYKLQTNASGNINFFVVKDTGNYTLNSTSSLPLNSWSHILITNDADNMTSFYLNGKKESNLTMNGTIPGGTASFALGSAAGKFKFNGTMDSFIIYNRTLSEEEAYEHFIGRYHNSNGEYTPALHDVFQYRAIFETSDRAISPKLTDINIKLRNYSTYIQNSPVSATNITAPGYSLNLSDGSYPFNWTNATDVNSDYIYYEFVLSNFTNLSNPIISRLGINNFSEMDKADDNYTFLVEHFENMEDIQTNEWLTNGVSMKGKWGDGLLISDSDDYLKIPSQGLISNKSGTIEFWLKPNWDPTDQEDNFFIHQNNDRIELNRTNSQLNLRFGINKHVPLTYNISSWSASEWHHIAFSWESEKNISLFIDGVQVNKTSLSLIDHALTGFFYLGSTTSPSLQIDGVIDEVRISNVARDSITNLNWTNYSYVSPSSYPDGTYIWQARALSSTAQESERQRTKYFSAWDNETIVFETRSPVVTVTEDLTKDLSDGSAVLELVTDEIATCFWKNKSISFEPMTTPQGIKHIVTVNITEYGIDTFYFLCNDSFGRTTNDTTSFYVFKNSDPLYETSVKFNTTANQINNLSLNSIDAINFTTLNNMSGKAYLIVHFGGTNPEYTVIDRYLKASTTFYTYFLDENIEENLTGNSTIRLAYTALNVFERERDTARVYHFNHSFENFTELQPPKIYTLGDYGGFAKVNITEMGTYTFYVNLTADLIEYLASRGTSSEGSSSSDDSEEIEIEIEEEEFYELEFYFTGITGGEENYLDVYDEETGVLELYFTSNLDKEDVFILVGSNINTEEDIYKSFYIDGLNLRDSELETLSLIYGLEKSWLEDYLDKEVIIKDSDGNIYSLELIDEDDDYFYYYADLNIFDSFYVTVQDPESEEVLKSAAEEEVEDEEEGFAEEVLGSLLAGDFKSESISTTVAILLYIIIANLAIFYFFRFGISTILSSRRLYDIDDEELTFEEDDEFTSKLKKYIYSQIEIGKDPSSITKTLTDKGWDAKKVKDIINNFKL